jgi:hypothetical protein
MGSSFYLGWLIPRETSLVIWGAEREKIKGLRFKGQSRFSPSQITAKRDSQREGIPLKKAPVCETRQIKLKRANSG